MSFVPFHSLVTAKDAAPDRWMLVLHGILGSGANWRTFIKRVAAARPAWGFVLVDLRMHGQSQGAPPPHTIASAAADLFELERAIDKPVRAILGHSFGGKVALEYVGRNRARLEQAFIIDSNLGTRDADRIGSMKVLRILEQLPPTFASRHEFVDRLLERKLSKGVVDWLAMNVRAEGDRYRFGLDLAAIHALLDDYFARDLWPVIESSETEPEIHLVVGGKSDGHTADDLARAERDAEAHANVHYRLLPKADHWVHVEDPDGLFDVVASAL